MDNNPPNIIGGMLTVRNWMKAVRTYPGRLDDLDWRDYGDKPYLRLFQRLMLAAYYYPKITKEKWGED